jgi:hypothetical protein
MGVPLTATKIIKEFNDSYIDDTNMDKEDY